MVTSSPHLPGPVRWAVGAGALSTAFVAGVVVAGGISAGTSGPAPGPPVGTLAPVASKDSLHAFDGCGALLDWYVDRNLSDVGPYGWKLPPFDAMYATEGGLAVADGAGSGALPGVRAAAPEDQAMGFGPRDVSAVGNSETGTNVQEVGVDEPDTVKTDGSLLVRIQGADTVVLTDVSGAEPAELARYHLADGLTARELLLVGDHVLVTASNPLVLGGEPTDSLGGPVGRIAPALPRTSTVLDLDVADPRTPRLAGTDTYSGDVLALRRYGDVVRVVTSTPRPELGWVHAGRGYDEEQATERNREILHDSRISDWLPRVRDDHGGRASVDCDQVFRPPAADGDATLAVFAYQPGAATPLENRDQVAVTTESQVVYSSTDRLYVATTRNRPGFWRAAYGRVTGQQLPSPWDTVTTQLHSFALDNTHATYAGSGHVAGSVRDRWSLDEQDGRLRVAVSRQDAHGGIRDNGVAVLVERGGALEEVARLDGLGPGEELKAVRWFGDFALVVTFRQTDPLYTIDFADPEHPRAVGALEVPGYSGYLHPIGGGLMVGVGQDATLEGSVLGAQVAVFDVGDLAHPRRLDQLSRPDSDLRAVQDPRAFTWLPGSAAGTGTAVTVLDDWQTGQTRALRLDVGAAGTLRARDLGPVPGLQRAVPVADGRVALVGEGVRLVDAG